MVIGCVAFPFGWNSDDFRKICGPDSNRFDMGLCGIRWAYPLAIIGCIDGIILATLAFILATRHVRLQPEPVYQGSMYKGKALNVLITYFKKLTKLTLHSSDVASIAGSRKSMNLQPVLLVSPHHGHHPHHHMTMGMGSSGSGHVGPDDTISQFSSRTAANRYNRPDFHSSMHQFQL